MLAGWWGKFLLLVLIAAYGFGLYTAYTGTFVEPMTKKALIRRGSKHYSTTAGRRHRGAVVGGGFRSGK